MIEDKAVDNLIYEIAKANDCTVSYIRHDVPSNDSHSTTQGWHWFAIKLTGPDTATCMTCAHWMTWHQNRRSGLIEIHVHTPPEADSLALHGDGNAMIYSGYVRFAIREASLRPTTESDVDVPASPAAALPLLMQPSQLEHAIELRERYFQVMKFLSGLADWKGDMRITVGNYDARVSRETNALILRAMEHECYTLKRELFLLGIDMGTEIRP
jgi:hypothetical protein